MRPVSLQSGVAHSILLALLAGFAAAHAQTPSANLTGRAASIAEGALEGVLVSARKDGSSTTHTVVSDAAGRFDFASARLAARSYALKIRAAGYELDSTATANIPTHTLVTVELNLRKFDEAAFRQLAAYLAPVNLSKSAT